MSGIISREIVIARHKEDLIWLDQIPDGFFVIVYDKSGDSTFQPTITPKISYWKLPNIGNEAHTYLYHIVENYNNLADVTIFTQAWPFDHDRGFIQRIQEPCEGFTWLSHEMLRNEWNGYPHHSLDTFVDGKVEALQPDWLYCAIMGKRPPDYWWFGQGGQHMVTQEVIHRKPKAFYQRTIDLITGPFARYKPWCAMERFWDRFYLEEITCCQS